MLKLFQNTEFVVTFLVFLAGGGLAGGMAWLERRPRDGLSPSLVPTTPLMLIGLVVTIFAFVHLLNLGGIRTGR